MRTPWSRRQSEALPTQLIPRGPQLPYHELQSLRLGNIREALVSNAITSDGYARMFAVAHRGLKDAVLSGVDPDMRTFLRAEDAVLTRLSEMPAYQSARVFLAEAAMSAEVQKIA